MNMAELYQSIMARPRIYPGEVKEGSRIAVILPDNSIDIMKIGAIAYARRERWYLWQTRDDVGRIEYAVATVCPHQASVVMSGDGSLKLNELVDTEWLAMSGGGIKGLDGYARAHMACISKYPVVRITKEEMRLVQEAIESRHRELKQ